MQPDAPIHRTPCVLVFLAWLIVCVPAGWGITQTVMRSRDLFRSPQTPQNDLHSQIGQMVHLEGEFNGPGKEADYILVVGKDGIYLPRIDSGGAAIPYGSWVSADGVLQFQKFPPASQPAGSAPLIQIPPDYFFIENAKIHLIRPPSTAHQ
jgi:hypothetical protein